MRIFIVLQGLFLVLGLSACGSTAAHVKSPVVPDFASVARVPSTVNEKNYVQLRDAYDALTVRARGREAYRQVLMRYLLAQANDQLRRKQELEAYRTFREILGLYDASEVFHGGLRQPALADLARRLAAIYAPRGEISRVLLAMCVRMSLEPERKEVAEEFQRMVRWTHETEGLLRGPNQSWARLIRMMERSAQRWPSPFVVDALARFYVAQRLAVARAIHISPYQHLRGAVAALFRTGYKLSRLYLRIDQPQQALKQLEQVAVEQTPDDELARLLQQSVSPRTVIDDQLKLAEYFEPRDKDVALRVCRGLQLRFPEKASSHWCTGRIAAELGKLELSIMSLELAVRLEPTNRPYTELLAQQYQRRLFVLIGNEELVRAQQEMPRVERFYQQAKKHFREPLAPPLSGVYYAVGQGLYNAGHVAEAVTIFRKSLAIQTSPEVLLQLATIHLKRGQPAAALEKLGTAERVQGATTPQMRFYWQGKIAGLRAQALELSGRRAASREAHRQAIVSWQNLRSLGIDPEDQAESYVQEARSLFALDERGKALDAIDHAIDVQPDRKETYADAVAMLATYGHLPEALDAYHRALGRRAVSEYLKTYCGFWIIGLARRAGLPPDSLAMNHLGALNGTEWYTELAKLLRGEASYETLLAKATSPSKRAELYYYWADQLVARGKLEEARALWKKVLATDMMAFYEYDMANYNLQYGPATVSTQPMDRQQQSTDNSSSARTP